MSSLADPYCVTCGRHKTNPGSWCVTCSMHVMSPESGVRDLFAGTVTRHRRNCVTCGDWFVTEDNLQVRCNQRPHCAVHCGTCGGRIETGREHLCSGDATGSLDGVTRIEHPFQGRKRVTSLTMQVTPDVVEVTPLDSNFRTWANGTGQRITIRDQDGDEVHPDLYAMLEPVITRGAGWDQIEAVLRQWNNPVVNEDVPGQDTTIYPQVVLW